MKFCESPSLALPAPRAPTLNPEESLSKMAATPAYC
jgi:hypothetical protein